MAFNQGPQPAIVLNENGVRYVDPNPTDEIVNHEDLVMYVKLVARAKGRSILTYDQDTDQTTVITEQKNVKSETNFTYQNDKQYLDTSWTNIGGGNINFGEDLGSFGITNIDIEFKSSFMPQIVIDFVDVRGAALFEQGPCSPYAVFFHLPYPVFELTVKGYYGRPVTYTLALVKFNTKFNSETGNFESKAEFVGYTYAFLADIPMGYVMAANFMTKPHSGKQILAKKWAQLLEKKILDESSFSDEKEPISIYDLIKKSKKLEQRTAELKESQQVKDLGKVTSTRTQLDELRNTILEFRGKLAATLEKSQNGGFEFSNGTKNKDVFFIKLPNTNDTDNSEILKKIKEVITTYLGDGSSLGGIVSAKFGSVQSYYTQNSIDGVPDITLDGIKNNTSGFLNKAVTIEGDLRKYSIDIYESMLKPIEVSATKLSEQQVSKKDEVRNYLNSEVVKTLGFLPTVSNVFAIILTNVEVFLELLLLTSRDAEKYHEEHDIKTGLGDGTNRKILELKNTATQGSQLSDLESENQPNKIYPWPTYYEEKLPASATNPDNNTTNNSGEVGSKETYPGENSEYVSWPEVVFVENFIKALTRLKGELEVLELEKENLPGFDNFAPITAYETHAFGNTNSPNRWYRLQQSENDKWMEAIYKIMGENAFILGDYTMINTLSVWKSQLGFRNGWGVETLSNYQGNTNGYTPAPTGGFYEQPQRLAQNPKVNVGATDLNRYNSKGFHYETQTNDKETESFPKKIVPTTRAKMKKWGYVDALNLMTTLKLDNETGTIISWLKTNITTANKATIKQKIKEVLAGKIKTQSFDDWKVSATQEIGGTVALIDKQSIWNGHFNYVKKGNVLTYSGPITLNEFTDDGKSIKIHPNPHNNTNGGATLVTVDEIATRQIDFSSQSLPEVIKQNYTKKYANVAETESTVSESKIDADISSLAYTLLKFRPKTSVNKPNTAYTKAVLDRKDVNLSRDKNTNMLSLGTYFYPNFFHTYENNEDLSNAKIIFDLSSSRRFISHEQSINSWVSFMGSPHYNYDTGSANSIINTPLWTLNYPLYKNAWNYADGGGGAGYIGLDELFSVKSDGNSAHNFIESDNGVDYRYKHEIDLNTKRNWGTWWGLNQWGVDSASDYYKPLAYMAVMSLGFTHPTQEYMTGHFPPWDGNSDKDISSFSNFTSTAIVANLPKSYVLLIGAILWRMKETGLLRWDKDKNGEGIKPKRDQVNLSNKGWNSYNVSFSEDLNGSPGIDDLNDPVWFFHNSTSKPWFKGGSVYAIKNGQQGWNIKNSEFSDGFGKYERRWVIENPQGVDRWTNGGGSIYSYFGLYKPALIGKKFPTGYDVYVSSGNENGWRKTHTITKNPNQLNQERNDTKGFYDMCRADQMPFLMSYFDDDFQKPRTLVITSFSKKVKSTSPSTKPNLYDNAYPILKEECKELMFIPRDLKIQFIDAFENWATSENGKWLSTIDPLNWLDTGSVDNYTITQSASVNNDYIRKGYRGFLTKKSYDSLGYNTVFSEESKNPFLQKFAYEDSESLGSNSPIAKKNSNAKNKLNTPKKINESADTNDAAYEPACFVSGTKIKLVDGNNINIEDLTLEHKLLTYNLNKEEFEESTIGDIKIDYRENLVIYYFENGTKITCTDNHPFWVIGKGWSSYRQEMNDPLNNKQIVIGDKCLYYSDGKFNTSKLSNIVERNDKMSRVWNVINVSGNNNFIVNNLLVHNKGFE